MRVISLQIENIKKVSAAQITPPSDASLVTIAGKNCAGKSSILDSIYWALGGKPSATNPIKNGEQSGKIKVQLGESEPELIVERQFSNKEDKVTTSLRVSNPDGSIHKSPQQILDSMIGLYSFDPLEFCTLKPEKQYAQLTGMIDLPINLDEINELNQYDYEKRRQVNVQGKELAAVVAQMESELAGVEHQSPINVATVFAELQKAQQHNAAIQAQQLEINAAKNEIDKLTKEIDALIAYRNEAKEKSVQPIEPLLDVSGLQSQISAAETVNANAKKFETLAENKIRLEEMRTESRGYTSSISARKATVSEAISKAKMPLDGMSISWEDQSISYNGQPFNQASTSEQLEMAVALSMQSNPKIKILRVAEGSLLDSDSTAEMEKIAEKYGYQIWLECVQNEQTTDGSFFIVDGSVS